MLETHLLNWALSQAYIRLRYKQYDQCAILLKGLAELSPNSSEIYRMLSYVYLETNKSEECIAMVDRYQQCLTAKKGSLKECDPTIARVLERAQFRLKKQNSQ